MPLITWRLRPLVRARERLASTMGMGQLHLTATMPSGHTGTLMPERMYFIDDSQATLNGVDLGRPTHLRANPAIGGMPLPARGVLATGQAVFEILDPAEYQRTRSQAAAAALTHTMSDPCPSPGAAVTSMRCDASTLLQYFK